MNAALVLAFLSGFIALSYEILWYRALSFMSEGRAPTFALMLGAYLTGLALGSLAVRRCCRDGARPFAALFGLTLAGNVLGFFVVPVLTSMSVRGWSWTAGLFGVGVAAAALGTVFPLAAHAGVEPDARAGRRVSYLYLANILGSTGGSLVTGFVLMDRLSLGAIHVVLALLGIGTALLPAGLAKRPAWGLGALLLAAGLGLLGTRPFDAVYEKLQLKKAYDPQVRFAQVVETKSGVITVNRQGQIFGGGIYDGAFNTSLVDDKNAIIRCYALAELHPAPREALMIGLSSGSWAQVLARRPGLERLTIVEINPGYLSLIPKYPEVAGLLQDPRVRIEIDDGRRWLLRNRDRKFDLIVANATFHFRSNATNLLSREYLELVRSRLNPGGIYYYNTTGSARAVKTGSDVFGHALKVAHFLAVGDSPLPFDRARLKVSLMGYPGVTGPVFDRGIVDASVDTLEIEPEEALRARVRGEVPITDDNMGTEWEGR